MADKSLKDKIETIKIEDVKGQLTITYQKSKVINPPSPQEVIGQLMVAVSMQTSILLDKLSKGTPLSDREVNQLNQLANIVRIQSSITMEESGSSEKVDVEVLKSLLFKRLPQ